MARIDEDELRAIACLDRLKLLLDRYGRRVGAPYFVARGKDEGGHHLRLTLLPVPATQAPAPAPAPVVGRSRDDLAELIAEFQTLSDVVGAQHQQILDLIDVLATMDDNDARSNGPEGHLKATLDTFRATAKGRHLRVVRNGSKEASE